MTIEQMREEDLEAVVVLHREAFSGYLNTQLGKVYVRALMRWFLQAETAIALVAVDDADQVLGYVVGAPKDYGQSLNRAVWPQAVGGLLVRPWLLLQRRMLTALWLRIRPMLGKTPNRSAPTLPGPVMSLVGIAVTPASQGQRVGTHLLEAFEREACRRGMQALRLSVYASNTTARGFYERQGWTLAPSEGITPNDALYYFKLLEAPSPA